MVGYFYGAKSAAVMVDRNFVKKTCGESLDSLYRFLQKNGLMTEDESVGMDFSINVTWDNFSDYDDAVASELEKLFSDVRDVFKEKTNLTLCFSFEDCGNPKDLLHKFLFGIEISDALTLTPEAEKIKEQLEIVRFQGVDMDFNKE